MLTAQVHSNEQSVNGPAENFAVKEATTQDQQAGVSVAQTKTEAKPAVKLASNSSKG